MKDIDLKAKKITPPSKKKITKNFFSIISHLKKSNLWKLKMKSCKEDLNFVLKNKINKEYLTQVSDDGPPLLFVQLSDQKLRILKGNFQQVYFHHEDLIKE